MKRGCSKECGTVPGVIKSFNNLLQSKFIAAFHAARKPARKKFLNDMKLKKLKSVLERKGDALVAVTPS
jgi:hypothetical protein